MRGWRVSCRTLQLFTRSVPASGVQTVTSQQAPNAPIGVVSLFVDVADCVEPRMTTDKFPGN